MRQAPVDRSHHVTSGAVRLAVSDSGPVDGPPVVLLHGLTATREYVLMRSTRLQRHGFRVIAYDARGHGRSAPAPEPDGYRYDLLLADLLAVLAEAGVERALLVGASMGSHTALRLALEAPERVAGMLLITPAYDSENHPDEKSVARGDRLAASLREEGAEGFVANFDMPEASERRMEAFRQALRRQLAAHGDLDAVADALHSLLRARPFGALSELAAVHVPSIVVASRDDFDRQHPFEVALRYGEILPHSRVEVEEQGRMPLAWNGAGLSRLALELAQEALP